MVWDILCGGSFHRRIMTSGGRTATPARTVQLENEFTFAAMPAMDTAETQSIAVMALIDTSCIVRVYAPAFNNAVHECTLRPRRLRRDVPARRQPKHRLVTDASLPSTCRGFPSPRSRWPSVPTPRRERRAAMWVDPVDGAWTSARCQGRAAPMLRTSDLIWR